MVIRGYDEWKLREPEGSSDDDTEFLCGCGENRELEGAKACEECGDMVCAEECQQLLKCEGECCYVVLCHKHVTWMEGCLTFCKVHAAEHVAEMADMDERFPFWRVQRCTACGDPTRFAERLCRECSGINAALESLGTLQGEVR